MTLRGRLFALVAVVVTLTVVLVTATVTSSARRAFATVDAQRAAALAAQIRRELAMQGEQVADRLERVAASDAIVRTTADLGRARTDLAAYVGEAAPLASAYGLDFLDLVSADGTIISSAHAPARFGYPHPWFKAGSGARSGVAFLERMDVGGDAALGLIATRPVVAGDHRLYLIGGRRVDRQLLKTLALPEGLRVLLYRHVEPEKSRGQLIDAGGPVTESKPFEPLIARILQSRAEAHERSDSPGSESLTGIPLAAQDGRVVGALVLVGSGAELSALVSRIRWSGFAFGAAGIAFGCGLSYLLAARVTRPVEELAGAARAVAAGDWDVQPEAVGATGEVRALGDAFTAMTRQLADQRDRLVQAERVAAWRELARRLAHELKNPLFPLRITLDNLRRARVLPAAEFDEVFDESIGTLSTGLANLNTVIGRFSNFARMPAPELADASPNDVVQDAVRLFRAQLEAPGRPSIAVTVDLDPSASTARMDREQIGRVVTNLLLNAVDAMPDGGDITIRTRRAGTHVHLQVSDTGQGLTEEERARLFTPYYTTKQHGTGLGLAIVQSVIADHHGRIRVTSEPGRGTTFHIELPASEGHVV